METLTIQYFLSVARCRSFSRAAEANHISQSSFSKAIMRLEQDLGVKLIDRSSHPISLTPAGQFFYERMAALEPQFLEAMEELENMAHGEAVRVLICPRSFHYKIALDSYQSRHSDVRLQVSDIRDARLQVGEISDIAAVVESVRSGKYDFAICAKPFNLTDDIRVTTIYNDELYLLVAADSPFANRESISLMELDGLDFYESPYSKWVFLELIRIHGFHPRKLFPQDGKEMRREETIHRISLNKGVGIYAGRDLVPYRTAHLMHCVPIQEYPSFPVVLLERADSKDTPAKSRFRRWVLANLEGFVTERLNLEEFNRTTK